eukprot:m.64581 g.64581  ORF g.64581 m.64581 type:complete len:166 (+) comp11659_c0_seq3:1192-1689(+)
MICLQWVWRKWLSLVLVSSPLQDTSRIVVGYSILLSLLLFGLYHFSHLLNATQGIAKTQARELLVARACKTAVHELLHLCNIGHCMHRFCCMNGSGHLLEDFNIPQHLCPVCEAKFAYAWGDRVSLPRRMKKLLHFYKQYPMTFSNEIKWMERLDLLVTDVVVLE